MSDLWSTLRLASLFPTTSEENWPFISSARWAHVPPCCVLSQFTLTLWGTGPSVVNPSSPDFPRPSNNSCKTFDAQQICIGENTQPPVTLTI
ncbi:hypothetical protein GOODEAATRI_028326 [Goodea atripinnis]|uniref:Uncharacterized protein n=1 Tax=Goodea atripinnis TaxID=208336 RepID=A0ABV0PHW6_9TELE